MTLHPIFVTPRFCLKVKCSARSAVVYGSSFTAIHKLLCSPGPWLHTAPIFTQQEATRPQMHASPSWNNPHPYSALYTPGKAVLGLGISFWRSQRVNTFHKAILKGGWYLGTDTKPNISRQRHISEIRRYLWLTMIYGDNLYLAMSPSNVHN